MGEFGRSPGARLAFVLDDEPQVGAFVCKVLAASGVETRQFSNPGGFIAALKLEEPDLLVLDLALGQSDAVDVIRQLEVVKFAGRVLLISGRDEGTLREIERIGQSHGLLMLPPLQKPFRPADLRGRIAAPVEELAAGAESPSLVPQDQGPRINLKEALQSNSLELWYQPKIDLRTLSVRGAEALIRARHPVHGVVASADLMPAAGDPLHYPLSVFVLRRALADWSKLFDRGISLQMSINVPASTLSAPEFVPLVRQMIPQEQAFPGLLIEITEDDVIRDATWVHEVATQLRLYNAWISIDDFGSAYASLARLTDLPFVELKLARGFVTGCATNETKRGLCQTAVELAHRFGAKLCAEGIENAEDLRCLMTLGCDSGQGAFFAKPMPLDRLAAALIARRRPAPQPAPAG